VVWVGVVAMLCDILLYSDDLMMTIMDWRASRCGTCQRWPTDFDHGICKAASWM